MTAVVLRAEDVHVVRDGRPILAEVSLTVRAGEHWALLGANGAGGSTLLRLLGALVHPTRGTVEVLGHRLGRVDLRELRAHVGHVDPRHPPASPLRVRDVVLTGLTNSVEPLPRWRPEPQQAARAERLIGTLGLIGALEDLRREHPRLATVLVTHHLEELPAHTTHALLLREGRPLAGGPVGEVLTADRLGKCFDLPPTLERHEGRWSVRTARRA
ncbi:ATP-binding cassette domain-containing protein [Streptomyces lomondensis]|uniref:ABC transporter ATP-binding protein n=1 Tax=Streptomyces lomondensis TaxID=68229 RepID=A0ABQ2XJZ7_9ACTN|nr:ATP-binding cassette domain-containing protein [Streptomyces lomondensis]MCF0079238.1 ATP-binding cassette domain-containing protein [Streptomyces lomondensis]GGX20784.1 ABC transporter ATP-binding protein [Streptomyces lomondensis]